MYPIPPNEKLVETKTCRHCGTSFPITDKDLEFYDKVSPVFGGKKFNISTPTLCPDCRIQRRYSFLNFIHLYKRKSDFSGKEIVSVYSPDKPFKVYEQDVWWGDTWDPINYGKEFDFKRPFFDQFKDLHKEVPRVALMNISSENSEYVPFGGWNKNCYMVVGNHSENCYYGVYTTKSVDCVDFLWSAGCENGYEMINCRNGKGLFYSKDCTDCDNSYFLDHCKSCSNCFSCVNLTNKKYYAFNKPVTKEEFTRIVDQKLNGSYRELSKAKDDFQKFKSSMPMPYLSMVGSENSLGDNVERLKSTSYCYDSYAINGTIENCKFLDLAASGQDCYDLSDIGNLQLAHDSLSCVNGMRIYSSFLSIDSGDIYYSENCHSSSHLFGCIGLRNKSYCILNKQYTKEQYEELVPKIIEHMQKTGEWGEFFPSSLSPFGYNETIAQEYYPLSKEDATQNRIFNWSDYEAPFPKVVKVIPASKLPDNIKDIPDDILNWAIKCEVTKKPFRIIKQELEFYRKHSIPIPRRHPNQRYFDRISRRNLRKLFERKCDNCQKDMITTYAPERPEIVYCEECYNREVIG